MSWQGPSEQIIRARALVEKDADVKRFASNFGGFTKEWLSYFEGNGIKLIAKQLPAIFGNVSDAAYLSPSIGGRGYSIVAGTNCGGGRDRTYAGRNLYYTALGDTPALARLLLEIEQAPVMRNSATTMRAIAEAGELTLGDLANIHMAGKEQMRKHVSRLEKNSLVSLDCDTVRPTKTGAAIYSPQTHTVWEAFKMWPYGTRIFE
ncbi:MAG: hypothetical protein HYS81_04075 [Candidatus Aenigmatarchaeota archaeon]|nr:MAG: hypothetical protein HYS81_04075 [Candidatus Aenigmarchaeota archaeon]